MRGLRTRRTGLRLWGRWTHIFCGPRYTCTVQITTNHLRIHQTAKCKK